MKTLIDYINEAKNKEVIKLHEDDFIDFGLSVKWAKANLGATCGDVEKSWQGDVYQWGIPEICKTSNYQKQCEIYDNEYGKQWRYDEGNRYNSKDKKTVLDSKDDAVTTKLGSQYRMPTKEEFEELIKLPHKNVSHFCGITGLKGIVFAKTDEELTGKFNPNTMLFFPKAIYSGVGHIGHSPSKPYSACLLWSSSCELEKTTDKDAPSKYYTGDAYNANLDNKSIDLALRKSLKSNLYHVRAVTK